MISTQPFRRLVAYIVTTLLAASGLALMQAPVAQSSVTDCTTSATGFAGGTGDESSPYEISNKDELVYLSGINPLDKYYKLTADIDLEGCNWRPIQGNSNLAKLKFDGDGHVISGFYTDGRDDPSPEFAGFTGFLTAGDRLENFKLIGSVNVPNAGINTWSGFLSPGSSGGTVQNVELSGDITVPAGFVGGALGKVESSPSEPVLYRVGVNVDVRTTGKVRGAGGMIGYVRMGSGNNAFIIRESYSTGLVSGQYVTNETGRGALGGFIGYINLETPASFTPRLQIEDSYSTSKVELTTTLPTGSPAKIGGFIGASLDDGDNEAHVPDSIKISRSYSAGATESTAEDYGDGYFGFLDSVTEFGPTNNGSLLDTSDVFYDSDNQRVSTYTSYSTARTTTQMKEQTTFTNFDFSGVWDIDPAKNDGYPFLRWQTLPPSISSISPSAISDTGVQNVTISGNYFDFVYEVKLNGTALPSFSLDSSTSLSFSVEDLAAGTYDVEVRSLSGNDLRVAGLTASSQPLITTIDVNKGPLSGGETITATGVNLSSVTSATLGGVSVENLNVVSSTSLTFDTPVSASAGLKDLAVSDGSLSGTLANAYEYIAEPQFAAISPDKGRIDGITVTLTGQNLTHTSSVTVGGQSVSFTVVSDSELTLTLPVTNAGTADVVLVTPGGSFTETDAFEFLESAQADQLIPASGSHLGGYEITMDGSDLQYTSSITIGGANASFVVVDSETITITVPAGTKGDQDLVFVSPTGTVTWPNAFEYLHMPTVSSLDITEGAVEGGTEVTVTGTFLDTTTDVNIGGISVSFTAVSATELTFITPEGSPGIVNLTITNADGTIESAEVFEYLSPSGFSAPSPFAGPIAFDSVLGPVAPGEKVDVSAANPETVTGIEINGLRVAIEANENGFSFIVPELDSGRYSITLLSSGGRIETELTLLVENITISVEQESRQFWTKLTGDNVKLYAKNVVNAGKVQMFFNGVEIAWVRAVDPTDPKLRNRNGNLYLVRDRNLVSGVKNVFEIYVDGERVLRRAQGF